MVSQIKHWVNMLSKGKSGVEEPSVPFGPQVIETLLGVNAPVKDQDNHDGQGGAPNGSEKPREPFKIEPGQKVMVTSSTCTATKHPPAEADIDVSIIVSFLVIPASFENCFQLYNYISFLICAAEHNELFHPAYHVKCSQR